MFSRRIVSSALATGALLALSSAAVAHVAASGGPAVANKSQKLTFEVGHGCNGADTKAIRIDIPAGVTGVRALSSDFGKPTMIRDASNAIIAVEWKKAEADVQAEDIGFYELTIRARVPDVPFTRLQFNVRQTCPGADGKDVVVDWNAGPGAGGEPAPLVTVVPSKTSGWNKIIVPAGVTIAEAELATFFGDAQIVWRGTAAYSSNANTMAMITATPGVTALTGAIQASDELWVKY